MAQTLRNTLLILVLGMPVTTHGQEVTPVKLIPGTIPSCAAVCSHIMDLALEDVPEAEKAAARSAAAEVMEECVPQCETDLDNDARICFSQATYMADGDACDKALSERLKKKQRMEKKKEDSGCTPIR